MAPVLERLQQAPEGRHGLTSSAMTPSRERRLLQQVVAVAALVPVLTGLFGVVSGLDLVAPEIGRQPGVSADSHFRYLSGVLLGLGLCFWATIPAIEHKTTLFRFLTLIVFLGGLGRLLGLYLTGVPSLAMLGGLAMELLVTPALCLWQTRVAHVCEEAEADAELARHGV